MRAPVRTVPAMPGPRGGFTLVETLIAMVLSSFIIALVSHTFLVQNSFYAAQTLRVGAQDNVRAATELMAAEIRNTAPAGVVVAGARTMTVRSPMAVGIICDMPGGGSGDLLTDGGQAALDTDEVAGLALRDAGAWTFVNSTWASVDGSDGSSADNCAANGADTVGARDDFHRLASLNTLFTSPSPTAGSAIMVFRETTFTIAQSQLDASRLALFRAPYGGTPVEFATGLDTTAQFQYRTVGGTYADTITTGLSSIDAIRIVANAVEPAPTGGAEDVTFGWSVVVPLRTLR